ncbi:ABC transporter substrate-binding protein [Lutibacter sp. A64]|uniref:ABC transporter substrate-binding protein n=1 Tax=Lutibacter sp. A64 TaxID=2918526 RepID=UPI001F0686A5|nr:ABC transporter substrate-binding protein [Lutibacter sp. A64]UMB54570.1 ABC transporter substrate-binding protein [Lutibacter sp. A64]
MKTTILKPLILILIFSVLFSCKDANAPKENTKKISKNTLKYAKGFEIQHFKNYSKLIIKAPYKDSKETFEFILSDTVLKNTSNTIKTPINSIVVTSTTHIPMLELLEVENKLIGYPNTNYVSSKKTRKLIDSGAIKELGNEERINTELLMSLNPDIVVGFSINSNSKMFANIEKLGIPVLLNGDWLEATPLGRAEWIKFFGALFNKEKEADSIFNTIEANYLEAKKLALKSTKKPTILSGGLFKDIWNLPAGDSFEATFLRDANTNYLWADSKGSASLSLNIENVFEKGKNAEIWISPSFYNSFNHLEEANDIYTQFNAFKTKEIYSYINNRGATDGVIYFELAPARPDLVLKDLIKITHPELMLDYEFTFYEKLE